jgi:hypothetical protein
MREPDSIHPGRDVPPPLSLVALDATCVWVISITESFDVGATSIDEALSAAHQLRPGARVTGIKLK